MTSTQAYVFPGIDGPNGQALPIMGHFVLHVIPYSSVPGNVSPVPIGPPIPPPVEPIMPPNFPVTPSESPETGPATPDIIPPEQLGGWMRGVQGTAPQAMWLSRQQIARINDVNGQNMSRATNGGMNGTINGQDTNMGNQNATRYNGNGLAYRNSDNRARTFSNSQSQWF